MQVPFKNTFDHPKSTAALRAVISLALLALTLPALAQQADDSEPQEETLVLDPVTVIAYRQPRSLSEVAGTVSIITQDRIQRDGALNVQDLVRYEPGVEVDGGGTRFGFGGFRIRGIGGNRTAVVVDGVPVTNRFSVGNFADSGRGLLELGLVESAEILRGPASTIYGSKALGGVVSFSLVDTDDLLLGQSLATRISLAGSDDSNRWRTTAVSAAQNNQWSGLIAGSLQQSSERDVADLPDQTALDRLDQEQTAFLMRISRKVSPGRIRLTLDGTQDQRQSDLRALLGSGRFVNTSQLLGDDRNQQLRVLLDQQFQTSGWVQRGQWRVWHQTSDTRQATDELRPRGRRPVDLFRRFDFREENSGAGADLESETNWSGMRHRIGYGFEIQRSKLKQSRFATQTILETGATSNVVLGERFPLRDFPLTEVIEAGAYIYDEIQLWQGGPMLSPGVRFEYYQLDSQTDPLYADAFPDAALTDLDTSAWAPRLGLVWPLGEGIETFAQYARGFRSPPFSDVNIGLDIPLFNIRAIPNPDLRPERGHTLEAGLRWRGHSGNAQLSVYQNRYRDFISTRALVGIEPGTGTLLFQSINRERVRIEGAELRARGELPGPFSIELAAEWQRGEDRETGRSLPEISPPKAIVSIEYAPSPIWSIRFLTTGTRGQRKLTDERGDPLFSTPASTQFDLIGRWLPSADLSITLGLFNLADQRSWNHANVIGRPVNDPTLPLLAEPGRNFRALLQWQF